MTVTDFGSAVSVSLPSFKFAETGFGRTALGAENVFTLSTGGAVSVSPLRRLDRHAGDLRIQVDRIFGIQVRYFEPELAGRVLGGESIHSRQADASLCVGAASKVTGTKVASWNGTYIL